MSELKAFFNNGDVCLYCLECEGTIHRGKKGYRVIDADHYKACELSSRVLEVLAKQQEVLKKPQDALVHNKCYLGALLPRLKALQAAPPAARTRAAVKVAPAVPVPVARAVVGAEQKVAALVQEGIMGRACFHLTPSTQVRLAGVGCPFLLCCSLTLDSSSRSGQGAGDQQPGDSVRRAAWGCCLARLTRCGGGGQGGGGDLRLL